jgi:PAS domain S-box-containing protein
MALAPNVDLTRSQAPRPTDILSPGRMQAMLNHSWDIFSLLDAEGQLLYNSPAAQRLHGFEPSEMAGRNTFDFIHPEDTPLVAATFQECLTQPGQPVRVRYRYAHKDGSWIWMEAVAVNHLDNPSIHAIVVNSRDITDWMVGQQALKDSERFSDQVLDALRANLAVLDDQGRILKVNQGWRSFASAEGQPETAWEGMSYLVVCARAPGGGS